MCIVSRLFLSYAWEAASERGSPIHSLNQGEIVPLIHIDMTAGKATQEQKQVLIEKITAAVAESLGQEQHAQTIITIVETPVGNRAMGGKILKP